MMCSKRSMEFSVLLLPYLGEIGNGSALFRRPSFSAAHIALLYAPLARRPQLPRKELESS